MMDYSQLPEDIIDKIVREHLEALSELFAFSAVCKSWRSVAFRSLPRNRNRLCLPGLLVSHATSEMRGLTDLFAYCGRAHRFLPLAMLTGAGRRRGTRRRRKLPRLKLPHFPSRSKVSHILSQRQRQRTETASTSLFGLDNQKAIYREREIDLRLESQIGRHIQANHYLTSIDGWLLVLKPRHLASCRCCCHSLELYLLNPATRVSIPLTPLPPPRARPALYQSPSLDDFPAAEEITRAVLSASPDSDGGNGCHVILLFQPSAESKIPPQLAWCKVGGGGWEFTDLPWGKLAFTFNMDDNPEPPDAAYFEGKLYIADSHRLYIFHNLIPGSGGGRPGVITLKAYRYPFRSMDERESHYKAVVHLAESYEDDGAGGHSPLIIFRRFERHGHDKDYRFSVFKLVSSGKNEDHGWLETHNLDGCALFVDSHRCFALPAPCNNNGVRANRIYYAFDYPRCSFGYGNACGIFNLEDETREGFANRINLHRKIRSFWFLPMPWDASSNHTKGEESGAQLPNKVSKSDAAHCTDQISREFQDLFLFGEEEKEEGNLDDVGRSHDSSKRCRGKKEKKKEANNTAGSLFLYYYALFTIPLFIALLSLLAANLHAC